MGKMPFLLCSLPILGMGAVEQWDGVNTRPGSALHLWVIAPLSPPSPVVPGIRRVRALETLFTRPSVMTQRIHRALITQDRVIIKQDRTG